MASIFLPVDQAYDRWSAFYDVYDNPMVFMASEIVRRSLAPRVAGLDVFEFGCGTGRNLAALEQAGAGSAAGFDFSEGMLASARAKSPTLSLFTHDMSKPPVPQPDASADLVLFCLTLEHLEDLRGPLREARRIVRPDSGRIAVIEIHPFLSLSGLAAHFDDGAQHVRMPAFPHRFQDYLAAFRETGLQVTACREWRPADVGNPPPLQSVTRGPDFPLTLEFHLLCQD